MDEAKSLVGSADRTPVGVFTQKYLNHSQYGIGSGKAEEIKDFVKEYKKQTRYSLTNTLPQGKYTI